MCRWTTHNVQMAPGQQLLYLYVRHAAAFTASQLTAQDDQQEMQANLDAGVGWAFCTCKQQRASAIPVRMSEH